MPATSQHQAPQNLTHALLVRHLRRVHHVVSAQEAPSDTNCECVRNVQSHDLHHPSKMWRLNSQWRSRKGTPTRQHSCTNYRHTRALTRVEALTNRTKQDERKLVHMHRDNRTHRREGMKAHAHKCNTHRHRCTTSTHRQPTENSPRRHPHVARV